MKSSRGFTLIEVLVTLIIISIGFLGIALLQVTGVRNNNASIYRVQAAIKLDDIAERMRANPIALDNELFANVSAPNCNAALPKYCEEYSNQVNGPVHSAEQCDYAELAAFDIVTWYCGVRSVSGYSGGVMTMFPMADATIVCNDIDVGDGYDCTDGSPHTITISWGELQPNTSSSEEMVNQSVSTIVYP